DDVVRRIQALAFPLIGQHFHFSLLVVADDAAFMRFAGVDAALRIDRVPARSVRVLAIHSGPFTRNQFAHLAARNVAEQQIAVFRPDRSFDEAESAIDFFNRNFREILRGESESEQQERRQLHLDAPLLRPTWRLLTTDFTPAIFLASLVARSFCFSSS